MKIKVTFKDPDALHECVRDAVQAELKSLQLEPDEVAAIEELRCEKVRELAGKWFQYGEYICVEIDTDSKTCVVVPNR